MIDGPPLISFGVRPTDRASSIACGSSLTEALTRFLELIETPVVVGASTPCWLIAIRHNMIEAHDGLDFADDLGFLSNHVVVVERLGEVSLRLSCPLRNGMVHKQRAGRTSGT